VRCCACSVTLLWYRVFDEANRVQMDELCRYIEEVNNATRFDIDGHPPLCHGAGVTCIMRAHD
jgi:hypothetical protein